MTSISEFINQLGLTAVPTETPEPATPGCEPWCGGRGSRRLPAEPLPFDPGRVVPLSETIRSLRHEYCSCEAGQRSRQLHQEAIRAVADRERQSATARLWDFAQVPTKLRGYTLESYGRLPGANASLVDKVRRWQDVAARGTSLILWGAQGTYKTGLAVSLLGEALEAGQDGLFLVCDDWLSEIRATYRRSSSAEDAEADEWTLICTAAAVSLLVVDDVGTLSEAGQKILFRLINQRDSWQRPTILTTNLSVEDLETSLGKRTFDRLRGSAVHPESGETFICELSGESRR